jgi:DNA-binding NtrC family response regulator
MERITLYHLGVPVTYHTLGDASFSIGAHSSNDLVLAGSGVAERQLVIFRGANGLWRARFGTADEGRSETEFSPGTRVAFGAFSVAVEKSAGRTEEASLPEPEASGDEMPEPSDLGIAGVSMQTRLIRMEIARLGPLGAPIVIVGETGTGKELVARGLHACSRRPAGPFVAINCGGLTTSLLEDTFFGHERGAFTGASVARKGVFEQADQGTLFLDEIGELPLSQQAALLRILDEKKIRRIGAEETVDVDFRLIAATNRDLRKLIDQGRFRLDLYHRIAALKITTVPLRDRTDDIAPLASLFLGQMAGDIGERSLSPDAVERLRALPWPGNARELRNTLLRAAAMSSRRILCARDIDSEHAGVARPKRCSFGLDKVPDARIDELIARHGGNVAAAARELGVPRTSLRDRFSRQPGIDGNPPALDDSVSLAS